MAPLAASPPEQFYTSGKSHLRDRSGLRSLSDLASTLGLSSVWFQTLFPPQTRVRSDELPAALWLH
ncbi:hypothetical protein CO661_28380 [Sinorhizobium fredii]|uniref:Uncharacterized protein n=1 Tax=Rhizobium fredii TaxID=380 RepID=A0A2A6LQV9_RHIFR|nr:hypothetical protein CO661_28380 [Sinorhizobium fredii]